MTILPTNSWQGEHLLHSAAFTETPLSLRRASTALIRVVCPSNVSRSDKDVALPVPYPLTLNITKREAYTVAKRR